MKQTEVLTHVILRKWLGTIRLRTLLARVAVFSHVEEPEYTPLDTTQDRHQ